MFTNHVDMQKGGEVLKVSIINNLAQCVVLEWTQKYWTSNTPNIECPNLELSKHHILAQNWTSNMLNITKKWTVREHQTVCSKTSRKYIYIWWPCHCQDLRYDMKEIKFWWNDILYFFCENTLLAKVSFHINHIYF